MRHISTCLILWRALAHLNMSMTIRAVYTNVRPCQCTIVHQTWNSTGFLPWKWGTLLPYSHSKSLVIIVFCVIWCTWGETLGDFRHENMVKCYWIFAMEIWHQFQMHRESIVWDHTHSKLKPQSPTHLKPYKLMPIVCFQLPMSKNYDFTKTKDYPWIGTVGFLSPSPNVTRLLNSRIKIFLSIHIRLGKTTFFLA